MRNLANNNYHKSYLIDSILLSSSQKRYLQLLLVLPQIDFSHHPDNIFMFKVNNTNTRQRCKICSKLTAKALEQRLERRHSGRSVFFIVNIFQTFFLCFYF